MVEGGGVELNEFHVLYGSFGAVDHGYTVAGSNQWIGSVSVYGFATSCCHDGHFGEEGIHFSGIFVQYISAVAFDTRSVAGYNDAQVVLGNDFYREEICEYGDIGMLFYGFVLYFRACIVFVVQDAELRMSAFFMQVEFPVVFFVKVYPPFDEFIDLLRSVAHHLFHSFAVAYPVSGNHGVFNVLIEIIYRQVGDGSDSALCKISICLLQTGFTDEGHCSFMRHLQRKTHTGNSGTDNEEIELSYHNFVYLTPQNYKITAFLVCLAGINS